MALDNRVPAHAGGRLPSPPIADDENTSSLASDA
jgi:hypothetical protein